MTGKNFNALLRKIEREIREKRLGPLSLVDGWEVELTGRVHSPGQTDIVATFRRELKSGLCWQAGIRCHLDTADLDVYFVRSLESATRRCAEQIRTLTELSVVAEVMPSPGNTPLPSKRGGVPYSALSVL